MFNFENKNKMRPTFTKIMLMATILSFFGCKGNNDPSTWSESKTNEWFNKGEWRNGWTVTPDGSINKKSLASAYFQNKERWDKAFKFLKDNDLAKLENKRYDLDGDNLFVNVSEYKTKEPIDAKFEAHRKYIDIQYVIAGSEMIGVAPLASRDSITQPYNETKDVEFSKFSNETFYEANPGNFFVFFPDDGHAPSVKTDSISHVKKLVVKIRVVR
jgi:YhcH/YjgK/YiaL family protein